MIILVIDKTGFIGFQIAKILPAEYYEIFGFDSVTENTTTLR